MDKTKENIFLSTIEILDQMELLPYVSVMGSWAEYLYQDLFVDYIPDINTKDIDLMYTNIRRPNNPVPLINTLKAAGYEYVEDPITGTGKFINQDVEIEFLTKALGEGSQQQIKIESLGIISDSLRDINILDNTMQIQKENMTINIPKPSAFVIQKIIINNHRVPKEKGLKI